MFLLHQNNVLQISNLLYITHYSVIYADTRQLFYTDITAMLQTAISNTLSTFMNGNFVFWLEIRSNISSLFIDYLRALSSID